MYGKAAAAGGGLAFTGAAGLPWLVVAGALALSVGFALTRFIPRRQR
jgi:hypothetical protein